MTCCNKFTMSRDVMMQQNWCHKGWLLHRMVDAISTGRAGPSVRSMKRACMVSDSQRRWTIQLAVTKEVQQQLNVKLFPWMTIALKPATNPESGSTQQPRSPGPSPTALHMDFILLCEFKSVGAWEHDSSAEAVYQIKWFQCALTGSRIL